MIDRYHHKDHLLGNMSNTRFEKTGTKYEPGLLTKQKLNMNRHIFLKKDILLLRH